MHICFGSKPDKDPIYLNDTKFRRHGYILGQSGTGKSTFIANAFLQVIGSPEQRWGGILIDPAGDLVRDVSRRIPKARREDVVYIDPLELRDYPFALNPFAPLREDGDVDFLATEIMGVFRLLLEEYWDATLEAALRNVTLTLLSSRELKVLGERWWPALDEVSPLLLLEAIDDETLPWHRRKVTTYRQTVWYPGLEEADLGQVHQWFETYDRLTPNPKARMANLVISKLDRFLSNPVVRNIVCQEGSIDFRQVINEGKIVLVNLRQESLGDTSAFLASLIMAKVLAAVYHQTELEAAQRPPFAIFADEFHSYATPSLMELYRQGRKYGATVYVAHTDRGWLRPWQRSALGNAGNIFCFNLSSEDAWEMARVFDATPPAGEPEFRQRYRPYAPASVVLDGVPHDEAFLVETDFRIAKRGELALAAVAALYQKRTAGAIELDELRNWIGEVAGRLPRHPADAVVSALGLKSAEDIRLIVEALTDFGQALGEREQTRPSGSLVTKCLRLHRYFTSITGYATSYVQDRVLYCQTPGTFHISASVGASSSGPNQGSESSSSSASASSETGPVFDRVPGRPRPYSDVYHQIANELCHQPDYQAWCKLAGLSEKPEEVVLRTEPLSPEKPDWEADVAFFKEKAKGYGQPVEEVTEQLRRREERRRRAMEEATKGGGDGHSGYEAAPADQGKSA